MMNRKSQPQLVVFCLTMAMFLVAGLVGTRQAEAHGNGPYLQKVVGSYTIDVHYPAAFQAQLPMWLNFFLAQNGNSTVGFTDVDVTILKGSEPVLKTNVNKKIGVASGVIMTFPEAGDYNIYLVFNNGTNKVVEATFDIHVQEKAKTPRTQIWGIPISKDLGIGVILGLILGVLIRFYMRFAEGE